MAFNRYIILRANAANSAEVMVYNNIRYSSFAVWGEYILSPVLMDVSQFGFRAAAAANLQVAYNPIIIFGEYHDRNDAVLPNNLWQHFDVDGMRYDVASLNVTGDNRFIELAGENGIRIRLGS